MVYKWSKVGNDRKLFTSIQIAGDFKTRVLKVYLKFGTTRYSFCTSYLGRRDAISRREPLALALELIFSFHIFMHNHADAVTIATKTANETPSKIQETLSIITGSSDSLPVSIGSRGLSNG